MLFFTRCNSDTMRFPSIVRNCGTKRTKMFSQQQSCCAFWGKYNMRMWGSGCGFFHRAITRLFSWWQRHASPFAKNCLHCIQIIPFRNLLLLSKTLLSQQTGKPDPSEELNEKKFWHYNQVFEWKHTDEGLHACKRLTHCLSGSSSLLQNTDNFYAADNRSDTLHHGLEYWSVGIASYACASVLITIALSIASRVHNFACTGVSP